ncbi:MAG: hypothetical protein ACQEQF_01830 [Bacillota bacterium]
MNKKEEIMYNALRNMKREVDEITDPNFEIERLRLRIEKILSEVESIE